MQRDQSRNKAEAQDITSETSLPRRRVSAASGSHPKNELSVENRSLSISSFDKKKMQLEMQAVILIGSLNMIGLSVLRMHIFP